VANNPTQKCVYQTLTLAPKGVLATPNCKKGHTHQPNSGATKPPPHSLHNFEKRAIAKVGGQKYVRTLFLLLEV